MEVFRRKEGLHKDWSSHEALQPETDSPHPEEKYFSWPINIAAKQIVTERRRLPCQDMNIESNRINSFYTKKWSAFESSFKYRLANAGFYSTGTGDEVQCFSCMVEIKNWKPSDSPKRRHKQMRPRCRFVNGIDRRNIADIKYVTDKIDPDVPEGDTSTDSHQLIHENVQENFRLERNRLRTFKEWPLSLPVDPYELAANGFYVISGTLTVQCFACYGRIPSSKWKIGDRPMRKHRLLSPSCPFVLKKDTGNKEMQTRDRREALWHDIHQKPKLQRALIPKYPRFTSRESRLSSFRNWRSSEIVKPEDLADAGFVYSNDRDHVTCFCCGCQLEKWVFGDNPWEEHRRWSPHCAWLAVNQSCSNAKQIGIACMSATTSQT